MANDNVGKNIEELIISVGSPNFKTTFEGFVNFSLGRIEKNKREHIYFEDNPADPNLPHVMRDVNTAGLEEFMWLSYAMKHSSKSKVRRLTKEELKIIISDAVPTSKGWSETHKQIICTTIVCPCCNTISMIVEVSCQGRPLTRGEEGVVSGLYRVVIDVSESKIKVNTYKLEETPLGEQKVFQI